MLGKVAPGARVVIKKNDFGVPYKIGDIVMYENQYGENVLHEIVRIKESNGKITYTLKGANNQFIDLNLDPIKEHKIVGKVVDMSKHELAGFIRMAEQRKIPYYKALAMSELDQAKRLTNEAKEEANKKFEELSKMVKNDMWYKLWSALKNDPDLRNEFIEYETASRVGINVDMNDIESRIKLKLTRNKIISDLDLPSKFGAIEGLKITDGSEEALININFLHELKEDYETIPLKYRGNDSPEVLFYGRITDYFKQQGVQLNPEDYAELYDADGYYDPNENVIIIATSQEVRDESIDSGPSIAHEMGHYVCEAMDIHNSEEWNNIYNSVKENLDSTGDFQASENSHELFADAFAEYYTGKLRGRRLFQNYARLVQMGLLNEDNNLNGYFVRNNGILDDYPIILRFLTDKLGLDGAFKT